VQGHGRPECERRARERLMNRFEAVQAVTGKIVECPAINGSGKGLAPVK